jgi:hypothetical protein
MILLTARRLAVAVPVTLALALAACGPTGHGGGDDDDDAPPGSLRLEPAQAELVVADMVPATQRYRVIARDQDGDDHDVSDLAELSLGLPTLGSFAGATLTTAADRGGRTTVRASWNGQQAEGDLVVRLRQVIVEPGVPTDALDDFAGAQPGGAPPALVYPDTGVIVPPNLNTMEVHFQPGAGNDVFQLTVHGSALELVVYFTCSPLGAGCGWDPSQRTWDILATAGRGDAPLDYRLRGLDHDAASPRYGESEPRTLQFATDDLEGGLYYWAAGVSGAVMRYDFGRRGQTAERFLGVQQTSAGQCVGCHALSRDGSKIAVGLDIPGPATLEAYSVGTRARLWTTAGGSPFPGFPSPNGANFFAFSPDATRLVSSDGVALTVRNADDGSGAAQVVANATMPDWSPDGARVVFARGASQPAASPGVMRGSIVTVDASGWNGEQMIVPSAGENNYYPSYAPDSQWVLFNRSQLADSFDATDARVMVVAAAGGAPIALGRATSTAGDSWPKWAPLVHEYAGGPLMWMTVSSRRPYGLRAGGTAQLWMVGFDPARAARGEDPSFAAFWLPFQDAASGNHIAQWVEHVDRQPCTEGSCPAGEFCEGGYCVPDIE